MATIANFAGKNTRSLSVFLNQKNSDIDFVKNPNTGKIFAVLSATGESVTVSENAQQDMIANGLGTLADYQVCDMPGKDAQTGMPNGTVFALITKRGTNNVIGSLCR